MIRIALSLTVLVFGAVVGLCEEGGGNVEISNNTKSMVTIYFDNQPTIPSTSIPPGGTSGVGTIMSAWPSTITAKDPSGNVVFSRRYTWDEIKNVGWRVVIGCDSTPTDTTTGAPTATATPC
jgi:hypothetical protein